MVLSFCSAISTSILSPLIFKRSGVEQFFFLEIWFVWRKQGQQTKRPFFLSDYSADRDGVVGSAENNMASDNRVSDHRGEADSRAGLVGQKIIYHRHRLVGPSFWLPHLPHHPLLACVRAQLAGSGLIPNKAWSCCCCFGFD